MELYLVPENIACGKVKLEAPPLPSEEPLENHSNSSSNKQNSIFTLTLDEFQYKSGKSFGSMNMDEFLTSVWNAEGSQASPIPNQNDPPNDHDHNVAVETTTLVQPCSLSIPTSLCNKTVEEVWSEINRNETHDQQNPSTIGSHELPQRLQTFGEMTLEDFLVKAGVIQEACSFTSQQRMLEPFQNQIGNNYPSSNACLDVNVGTAQVMSFELSNHSNTGSSLLDNDASLYHMFTQNGRFVGESTNNTGNGKCISASDATEPSIRRRTSGTMEVAVERRQRRMIKNRESAARSRARKQAYTAELEIELNQLREENARLKLILAEAEIKRRHEMIKGKQGTKAHRVTEKLRTIRRSSSLAW